MKPIRISVVIPTHRRTLLLRELLGSLERQNRRVEFEVLVIGNLPEFGLKKVVESYGPRFRFLETGRIGVNIARNKGVERARGEIVLFLDDDCYVPDKDFLERVWKKHEDHPQALAIGGPYSLEAGAGACERAYHLILHHRLRTSIRRYHESTSLLGGNWSFKTSLIERRLRFDDSITFGGSDVDLFSRLRKKGASFVVDETLAVFHRVRLNLWSLARRAYKQGLAHGRYERSGQDRSRHWNSTLTLEECAAELGLDWTRSLAFYVGVYDRVFRHGVRMGRERPDSAPRFSVARLLNAALPDFGPRMRVLAKDGLMALLRNAIEASRSEAVLDSGRKPTET